MPADGVQKALGRLEAIVDAVKAKSGVPGIAVGVIHGGQPYYYCVGDRDLSLPKDKREKVDKATVFQIASISKSISATLAARMMTYFQEQGNAAAIWEDPVVQFLGNSYHPTSDYVWERGTIGDYFAHRSGLPAAAGDDLEGLYYQRSDILLRLNQMPLDPFRVTYNYCNFGLTIGAEAIARAAGKPWEELGRDYLFNPLHMFATSYRYAEFRQRENRAALHSYDGTDFAPSPFPRNPDAQAPAGGVSSNVVDLVRWMDLLLALGRSDSKPALDIEQKFFVESVTPQSVNARSPVQNARSGCYGYGFNVGAGANGRMSMSHSGAFFVGAATAFHVLPDADVGIVVLTNGAPVGAAEAIVTEFMDIVQFGDVTRNNWYEIAHDHFMNFYKASGDLAGNLPPQKPNFPHPLAIYEGVYSSAYFGEAEVWANGDHLILQLGPRKLQFVLKRWDADIFQMDPGREFTAKGSLYSVRFALSGGRVTSMTAAYFNDNILGIFPFARPRGS
ncbi:serine hydrolase [Labrys sedimenti]|uniref:serine hydrolase n=1 Tax=Labrys sedimenti TaxID=3106036 RepID=UPI002ACAF58D|nr:serine hydrolase [Labrys sp. ZIDIC5]MDZ5452098.1 serine hydrolase [Labrys sp. ZIDIC5]